MQKKFKIALISYAISSGIFSWAYLLGTIGGYDNARGLCTTTYNVQRLTTVLYYPVCWLTKRVKQ